MLALATLRRTLNLFSAVFLLNYISRMEASKYIYSSFKLHYLRKNPRSFVFKSLFYHVLFLRRCNTLAFHEQINLRLIILLPKHRSKRYINSVFFSMSLPAHSGPRPLIQFRNHFSQTVGLLA
jgi:hypothetical protein